MEVKIYDTAFAHTDYSTLQQAKHFTWIRTNEPRDVCFFTDSSLGMTKFSTDKVKVAWLIEPRAINPHSYTFVEQNYDLFDYILTYDTYLLNKGGKFLFYPHGGCWINDSDKQLHEKTKFCSIIASSKNQTEGHKLRHEIIKAVGGRVDVYGFGYNKVINKADALRDYKYSIVIENSIQDDYFTEKLIDTLVTGTIPLYWGTPNVNKYFTNIPIFNSVSELGEKLDFPEKIEYTDYHRNHNLEVALGFSIAEDYFYDKYRFLFE